MEIYPDASYAHTRLIETIVMLKDKPVRVERVEKNGAVLATDISNSQLVACSLRDLDITPVPLGYINLKPSALYLTRTPMRADWRQGLRNKSMRFSNGNAPRDVIGGDLLKACISGTYPTILEAYQQMYRNERLRLVAFSRSFALRTTCEIEYKGRWVVGKISVDKVGTLAPEIDHKYGWLAESFEEELVI